MFFFLGNFGSEFLSFSFALWVSPRKSWEIKTHHSHPYSHSQVHDYSSSYQNTMGRRSTLVGPYTHMSKYSYPTDVSLSSHYGYTSWGLWRDSRNLSSSMYTKNNKNVKSFSIILMSAAFIVILAVIAVAGLAFYFSTFKSDSSECEYNSPSTNETHTNNHPRIFPLVL